MSDTARPNDGHDEGRHPRQLANHREPTISEAPMASPVTQQSAIQRAELLSSSCVGAPSEHAGATTPAQRIIASDEASARTRSTSSSSCCGCRQRHGDRGDAGAGRHVAAGHSNEVLELIASASPS
jgi:hypothetical protein